MKTQSSRRGLHSPRNLGSEPQKEQRRMSDEESLRLINFCQKIKNSPAFNKLLNNFAPLINAELKKIGILEYSPKYKEFRTITDFAFYQAVLHFNPLKKAKLSTLAYFYIRGALREEYRKFKFPFHVPASPNLTKIFYNYEKKKKEIELKGRALDPNLSEEIVIAKMLNVKPSEVAVMREIMQKNYYSLDQEIKNNDGEKTTHKELLTSEDYSNSYDDIDSSVFQSPEDIFLNKKKDEKIKLTIQKSMSQLNSREKDIIKNLFMNKKYKKVNLEDLAKKFKISKERVRQVKEAALKKLKSDPKIKELNALDV